MVNITSESSKRHDKTKHLSSRKQNAKIYLNACIDKAKLIKYGTVYPIFTNQYTVF